MTRKSYTVEFKQQAVELALSGEKNKVQTARDFGITEYMLYNWLAKYGSEALPPVTSDLQRLRRENQRQQQVRDILKTIGIFSEELR